MTAEQVKTGRDRKRYFLPRVRSLPMLLWCFSAIKKSLNFEVLEYLEQTRDGGTIK